MTKSILILYAHPQSEHSVANDRLAAAAGAIDHVTLVDLYHEYPDYGINVDVEQTRLNSNDIIIFQHPVFWYSCPAILKEWQDIVLEYGYAYGKDGRALEGKVFLNAVTTGGSQAAYSSQGSNHYPLRQLFFPFEQTANLCRMTYLPPFILYGARRAAQEGDLEDHIARYRALLHAFGEGTLDLNAARAGDYSSLVETSGN